MVEVLCPICNDLIAGLGEVDLSVNLQAHMHEVHGIQKLCQLNLDRATAGKGAESWDKVREEDLRLESYSDEAIAESHEPAERRLPGEDVPQAVQCPFCGEVIRGYAFDDFSYRLAFHVNTDHGIKVKWAGKG
jgi:hypothetical protein